MKNRHFSKKAVVLLSGGLDSSTLLYLARSKGFSCHCLIFDYGQRHKRELISAKKIARLCDSPYKVIKIELPWKGSALLDKKKKLTISTHYKIPSTYVPARNTIFLSYALSFAEAINAQAIFIAANFIDYSGYPDCRPEYYSAFRKVARLGTKRGVEKEPIKILTPLIKKTKAQIIKLGMSLGVPYEFTWSCYWGGRRPCGRCDSCLFRAKGFKEAGMQDPLLTKCYK